MLGFASDLNARHHGFLVERDARAHLHVDALVFARNRGDHRLREGGAQREEEVGHARRGNGWPGREGVQLKGSTQGGG